MISTRSLRRTAHLRGSCALVVLVTASVATFGQDSQSRFTGLTPRPVGPTQLHGAIGYVPPAGWMIKSGPNGVTVLTGPVPNNERPCEIWMLPPIAIRGAMADAGLDLVQGLAITKQVGPYRGQFGRDVRLSREEGVSGTGWGYADLSGELGGSGITVRVLMVQMGSNQVLPIIGYSKTWDCLGNQAMRDNDVWALLFHSLEIPGFATDSPELAQQLIGSWTSIGGNVGNNEVYAKNGRFGTTSIYQSYRPSSTPGMVLEVDQSWQGDGPYEVHGDRLHTQNPKGSDTERDVTRLFSIVRMPKPDNPSQFNYVLREVRRSYNGSQTWGFSPGGNYVTAMRKDNSGQ